MSDKHSLPVIRPTVITEKDIIEEVLKEAFTPTSEKTMEINRKAVELLKRLRVF